MAEPSNVITTTYPEYSLDSEIDAFFKKTSADRETCDAKARGLAGGSVVPVDIQGACSYTVYAGPELESVVQFRLKTLSLKPEVASLVNDVYGSLAPRVLFEGEIGQRGDEPLYVYLMSRMRGITHLDFVLANGFPENSADNFLWRKNLIRDIAHFLALSWKACLQVALEHRSNLGEAYSRDLRLLHVALPSRFQPIIQICIDSMDDIMSLPMVLLHRDLSSSNIIVDEMTCHLVGVIDWAEAEVCPFGLNLHSLQSLTGKLHLRNGWTRFEDYDTLQDLFWKTFKDEVGNLSDNEVRTIKLARVLGLLLSSGFTSRLANKPKPVPINDDEEGRYNMMSLDGFLINPQTKFHSLIK